MADWFPLVVAAVGAALGLRAVLRARRRAARERRIDALSIPPSIRQKVRDRYPHLSDADLARVEDGLRDYFHVCNRAGRRLVSMPSRVVDAAWHELILFTRFYQGFCREALGRFLHHTPAEAMRGPETAQLGIRRAWRIACAREGIDPRTPSMLPRIFALDSELAIPDGFRYELDCRGRGRDAYCAGGIGCAGGCAGDSGSDSGGDGCGGGCGGD